MTADVPRTIRQAIERGGWRNPAAGALHSVIGPNFPPLKLLDTESKMRGTVSQMIASGYVDDPDFRMIRTATDPGLFVDGQLVLDRALAILGSVYGGDDVVAVVERGSTDDDAPVFVLDWNAPPPARWKKCTTLQGLLESLD